MFLKNCNKWYRQQTDRQTLRLRDWIGPVANSVKIMKCDVYSTETSVQMTCQELLQIKISVLASINRKLLQLAFFFTTVTTDTNVTTSVFEILGKFYFHKQNRAQYFFYVVSWQKVTCSMIFSSFFSITVYKISKKLLPSKQV